jgi:hypothetical protein
MQITLIKREETHILYFRESSLSKKSSLNAELAVDGNNVYIIWQDFVRPNNQKILIKKSTDGGDTFTGTSTNISNNEGTSECPSIAISKNIIYAIRRMIRLEITKYIFQEVYNYALP